MRAENWCACLRRSNRLLRTVFEISLRLKRFLKNSCPAMLTTSAAEAALTLRLAARLNRLLKNSDARFEGRGFELRVGADAPSAQPSKARL
jgi:hypothetical protein